MPTSPCIDLPDLYRSEAFAEDLIDLPPPAPLRPRARPVLGRLLALLCTLPLSVVFFIAVVPTAAQAAAGQVATDLQMAQDAAPFRAAADSFVARAMAGDAAATLAMLSRSLVERSGEANIRRALDQQILPFFQRGSEPGRSVTVTRTTDAAGQGGFAFYMWLTQRDASAPRPYTVYVVAEAGRAVVANIVPDRLVEGRHR
jgi:hypothetical protein